MHFGLGALGLGDPPCGEAEGGLGGFGGRRWGRWRRRSPWRGIVRGKRCRWRGVAAELDDVGVGVELHVVADADRGDDDAEFDGDLAADEADAVEEVAALGGIDELDKVVADFQFHGVDVEEGFDFFGFFLGGGAFSCRDGGALAVFSLCVHEPKAMAAAADAEDQQRDRGQAGEAS